MFRNLLGYAVFAALVLFCLKMLGFVWGLLGTLLWLAFLGFVFYLVVRLFSPRTADKIKETIRGDRPM
jgi:predicted PurR-regulated permease PerM